MTEKLPGRTAADTIRALEKLHVEPISEDELAPLNAT
jgi:hypothetical protein